MDKPKLTLREIIFEGIKKFAGEIIGVVLFACFLWFFPSLKSLFTEHILPEKNESRTDDTDDAHLYFHEVRNYRLYSITIEQRNIGLVLLHFVQKMCKPFAYSITYLDKNGDVISVQVIRKNLGAFTLYPSLSSEYYKRLSSQLLSFAPGYIFHSKTEGRNITTLGTEEGYTVELDSDELQRFDSMKFEVIFG